MAIEIDPPEPDLTNIRKHLRASRSLWRLFGWGGAAAMALGALAIVSQTETGSQQIQLALSGGNDARAITAAEPPRRIEKDTETQRLEAQVRELAADRARLVERIASLERNLDDMTGSIKRQAAQLAAAPPAAAPVVEPPMTAPPVVVAPATPPAPTVPTIAPLAMPVLSGSAGGWPDAPRMQADGTDAVPLPPVRMAAAPATDAAVDPPAPPPPAKNEIGIDLGSAPNLEVLRLRWAAVKANYGPLLAGLSPVAAPIRRNNTTEIRLVVGPVTSMAAARALCARFAAARVGCHPARYDGQKLAQQ